MAFTGRNGKKTEEQSEGEGGWRVTEAGRDGGR